MATYLGTNTIEGLARALIVAILVAGCGGPAGETGETGDGSQDCQGEGCAEVTSVAVGFKQSCAIDRMGRVRCWGQGAHGRLGNGFAGTIGDDEFPRESAFVDLGGRAVAIESASNTCALLDDASLRCWGAGEDGTLGYGDIEDVGDDETPSERGPVAVGFPVKKVALGTSHACALSVAGEVRCWGMDEAGQLGRGVSASLDCEDAYFPWVCSAGSECCVGDDEAPESVPPVALGRPAIDIAAGGLCTCAVLDDGGVLCWGSNRLGELGYGNTEDIGDNEVPASMGAIELGGEALEVSMGPGHACARMRDGTLRCWGQNVVGQLGLGHTENIGDDEVPSSVPPVALDGRVVQVSAGFGTCAVVEGGDLYCWGGKGLPGQGDAAWVGDDEPPVVLTLGGPVEQVSVGVAACAILEDRRVRCWGVGAYGLLGDGKTSSCDDTYWCQGAACCLGDDPGEMPPSPLMIF